MADRLDQNQIGFNNDPLSVQQAAVDAQKIAATSKTATYQLLHGRDGEDGEPAPIIPGPAGIPGINGSQGAAGNNAPLIPGRDGEDGQDAFMGGLNTSSNGILRPYTPSVIAWNGTTNTGIAYSLQIGNYSMIGSLVFVFFRILLTNFGAGGTGAIGVSLPINPSAAPTLPDTFNMAAVDNATLPAGCTYLGWTPMPPGLATKTACLFGIGTGIVAQSMLFPNALSNNSLLVGSFCYHGDVSNS